MALVAVLRNNGITSDPFENGDANCLFVHTVSPGVIVLPVSVFFCAFLAVYMVSRPKLANISFFTLFEGKVQKGQQGNKDYSDNNLQTENIMNIKITFYGWLESKIGFHDLKGCKHNEFLEPEYTYM